jgi:hypothetical protein
MAQSKCFKHRKFSSLDGKLVLMIHNNRCQWHQELSHPSRPLNINPMLITPVSVQSVRSILFAAIRALDLW